MKFVAKIPTYTLVFILSSVPLHKNFKANASSNSNLITGATAIVGPTSSPSKIIDEAVGGVMAAWGVFRPTDGADCEWELEKPNIKEVMGMMLGMLFILPDCQYGVIFALNDGTKHENPICLTNSVGIIFAAALVANMAAEAAVIAAESTGVGAFGCSVAGTVAFHAALAISIVAATGILEGTASVAAGQFKVCDGGTGIVTPMAYPDSQIKTILEAMGINPSIENITSKYDSICIQNTSDGEYKWLKYEECWDKMGMKICAYAPDNLDPELALCARMSSTCPCAMAVQRGLIDAPEYDVDGNGVYQVDSDGLLKIKNDGTFTKRTGDYYKQHAGIHCKALRRVNRPPLVPQYSGIIDEVCHSWSGYSKNQVTLTAGVVQCIANTFENLFKKPLFNSTTRVVLTTLQQAQYNAYNFDYQFVGDTMKLASNIANNTITNTSVLVNNITSITSNTAFGVYSENGISISARSYGYQIAAFDSSNAPASRPFYDNLNNIITNLTLLGNSIDLIRENYLGNSLHSNVTGFTPFQSLQGMLASFIFLVLILYFIIIGFKMINGQFPLEASAVIPIFIDFALIYYFAIGSAWKDFALNLVIDVANGFATFAFEIPVSSAKIQDKCDFNYDYYIPSRNKVQTQSTVCGVGTTQVDKSSYTCDTNQFSITQSTPCIGIGVTQMYQCGSGSPQALQCLDASQQQFVCTIASSSVTKNIPCSTQNGTIQTVNTRYACTNNTTLCTFPPNSRQIVVAYDANHNAIYGCKRGPFIPPLQYQQIYKPVIYSGVNTDGTTSPVWLAVYCYNENNSVDTKQAQLTINADGTYQNLLCRRGSSGEKYIMEDGYRTSELNKIGIINSRLVSTDNNYNIIHTSLEITDSNGRIIDIINNIVNERVLINTSARKYQHLKLIETVRAAANRKERQYPIIKPFGPSGPIRNMSYVGIFDTLDCKAMSYFGYTPDDTEDVMYIKLMSGMLTSFPFGWVVVFIMIMMAVSMISVIGNLVQKYLVCFCGLMILFFISPLVFTCKLFPETAGYFTEWIDKLKGFLINIPLSFFMIGFAITLYDYALYGSSAIYSAYNIDGTANPNYIQVFNDDGTINKNCANNGNLSTAPLVCIAYYFINNVKWIGIPFTSIAIPQPQWDGLAFLYVFKTIIISLAISYGTSSILDILDKIFQSAGIGADTSLQGSSFNTSTALRDQIGAKATSTVKSSIDLAKSIPGKAKDAKQKLSDQTVNRK